MQRLGLEAAVYVFGFHLGLLVRSAVCLREEPGRTSVRSVADYTKENSWDAPMLAPLGTLERWLENNRYPF
ncbi:MAG TPA: hypothetical protein DIC34_00305 [Treponema sp.]|nr:MAG: hypothetical protein A2413_20370 [Treponema sp. RIFOXYC1_FULL_61_9]HCM24988.1 hypothetical protein [Treponema sp.]